MTLVQLLHTFKLFPFSEVISTEQILSAPCKPFPILQKSYRNSTQFVLNFSSGWLLLLPQRPSRWGCSHWRPDRAEGQALLGPRPRPHQAGAHEPVRHVHVRQHHLHLSHYDGHHDGGEALQDALLRRSNIQGAGQQQRRGGRTGGEEAIGFFKSCFDNILNICFEL